MLPSGRMVHFGLPAIMQRANWVLEILFREMSLPKRFMGSPGTTLHMVYIILSRF